MILNTNFSGLFRPRMPDPADLSAWQRWNGSVFCKPCESGDQVLVCQNGVFGGRMAENVTRFGGELVLLQSEGASDRSSPGRGYAKRPSEGKAGRFCPCRDIHRCSLDAKAICSIAAKAGCLTIVDCVTSSLESRLHWMTGELMRLQRYAKVFVVRARSFSFSMSDRAIEAIKAAQSPRCILVLDMNLVMGYWGENTTRAYHHTAPVNALYGLHQSLSLLQQEGLEASWRRHAMHHQALKAGLEALGSGLSFLRANGYRS